MVYWSSPKSENNRPGKFQAKTSVQWTATAQYPNRYSPGGQLLITSFESLRMVISIQRKAD